MKRYPSVLATVLTLTLPLAWSTPSSAAPTKAVEAGPDGALPSDQLAKVSGRAVLIGPDGQRQEFSFGNSSGPRLKEAIEHGGAHLEMKLAPNSEALRLLGAELEGIFKTSGVSRELLDRVIAALGNLESLGDIQFRGSLAGPEQKAWKLELGDDLAAKPHKFDKEMEEEGTHLELGVVPGPALLNLLTLAEHAPEVLRLLEFGFQNPDKLELLDQALQDPNLLPLLEKTLQDPQVNGLLQKALQNPALTDLLARQLSGGNAGNLLGLRGSADKPAAPSAPEENRNDSSPGQADPGPAGQDAELNALREELAAQRALLEKILEKLAAE